MNKNLIEQIAQKSQSLLPPLQQEALDFIEFLLSKQNGAQAQSSGDVQEFLKQLVSIAQSVPDEELKKIPTDGSLNADKYLYGEK